MTATPPSATAPHPERALLRLCVAIFLGYLTVALPLPVLPLHVRQTLGYSDFIVGVTIGVQFVATIFTRGYAGQLADTTGARRAMRGGCWLAAVAGVGYVVSTWLPHDGQLPVLILSRLLLGVGESLLVTGMMAWGIGTIGAAHSGKVITWTGVAIFGALAAGAPLGLAIHEYGGFVWVGAATIVLPLAGLALTLGVAPVAPLGGHRLPFRTVLAKIAPPSFGLMLQGVGIASINAFITLYFAARGWRGAGWTLTCFGVTFVGMRLLFGHLPDKLGGRRVALILMLIETAGLLVLWQAQAPWMGFLGAALTGAGCSLLYPSLGVEAVRRVPAQVRATALGAYAAFQDVAYAVTGPIAGLLAMRFGYPSVYLFAAIAALAGWIVVFRLRPAAAMS
ncbi:arabinose transporter [Luteimonas panaciterrae]|uniref:arabinose transporter n=1 Tax=Luteimonas panaciterrae TaxID=363885 RepID=UPI001CFB525F|nr:arabinose transporter [Luteimonas panaciterrae]